jgi:drug/metabolite transporter (DMT)-like permease
MFSARPQQNAVLGIALRIGAATCFALMATLIKLGYEAGATTVEMAFYRFVFGLPPLLAWVAWTHNSGVWRTERPFAHVWRVAIGLTTMMLAFAALYFLPLAESTTIGFAAPLFAVMLSALVLGEKVGIYRWGAVALGLVGVLVVMRPEGSHLPLAGLALALMSAFGSGLVSITIRQISRSEGTQTIVLWFTLGSMAVLALFMPFFAQSHDASAWLVLIALGTVGGFGQICLTGALRYAPVAVVVPFDYVQLVWAVLLGWLVFADQPATTTWIGAAIIAASGLFTLYREHKLGREKPRIETPL